MFSLGTTMLLKTLHEPSCPPPEPHHKRLGHRGSTLIAPCRSSPNLLSLPFSSSREGPHSNESRITMMLSFSCLTKAYKSIPLN
jgi:hypothetical protein